MGTGPRHEPAPRCYHGMQRPARRVHADKGT
jgi:hypothetical protein